MTLELWLRFAGCVHFGILIASGLTPVGLKWRENLASLHPFLRRLFWVYGAFIALVIASFGVLTLLYADAMARGEGAARGLCGFIAVFWLVRLGVQLFVFDARPFLTNWFYRVGYQALTLAFIGHVAVYGTAVLWPR